MERDERRRVLSDRSGEQTLLRLAGALKELLYIDAGCKSGKEPER